MAQLHISDETGLKWEILKQKEIDSDELYEKVIELTLEGESIRKIVEILHISKNKVHSHIIKARENGDLPDQ